MDYGVCGVVSVVCQCGVWQVALATNGNFFYRCECDVRRGGMELQARCQLMASQHLIFLDHLFENTWLKNFAVKNGNFNHIAHRAIADTGRRGGAFVRTIGLTGIYYKYHTAVAISAF